MAYRGDANSTFNIGSFFRLGDTDGKTVPSQNTTHQQAPPVNPPPSYPSLSHQIAPNFMNWTMNPTPDIRQQQASHYYPNVMPPNPSVSAQSPVHHTNTYFNLESNVPSVSTPKPSVNKKLYAKALARKSELGLDSPHSAALEALRCYSPENRSSPPLSLSKKTQEALKAMNLFREDPSSVALGYKEGKQPFYVDEGSRPLRSILKRGMENVSPVGSKPESKTSTPQPLLPENIEDEDKYLYGDSVESSKDDSVDPHSSAYSKWSVDIFATAEKDSLQTKNVSQNVLRSDQKQTESNSVSKIVQPLVLPEISLNIRRNSSKETLKTTEAEEEVVILGTMQSAKDKKTKSDVSSKSTSSEKSKKKDHSSESKRNPLETQLLKYTGQLDSRKSSPTVKMSEMMQPQTNSEPSTPSFPLKRSAPFKPSKPIVSTLKNQTDDRKNSPQSWSEEATSMQIDQDSKKTVSMKFIPLSLRKVNPLKPDKVFQAADERSVNKNLTGSKSDIFSVETLEDHSSKDMPSKINVVKKNVSAILKKQETSVKNLETKLQATTSALKAGFPKSIKKIIAMDVEVMQPKKPEPFSDRIVRIKKDPKLNLKSKNTLISTESSRKDRSSSPSHHSKDSYSDKYYSSKDRLRDRVKYRTGSPRRSNSRERLHPKHRYSTNRGSFERKGREISRSPPVSPYDHRRSRSPYDRRSRSPKNTTYLHRRSRSLRRSPYGHRSSRSPYSHRSRSPNRSPYTRVSRSPKHRPYQEKSRAYSRSPERFYGTKHAYYKDKSPYTRLYDKSPSQWSRRSRSPSVKYSEDRTPARWSIERSPSRDRTSSSRFGSYTHSESPVPHYKRKRSFDRTPSDHSDRSPKQPPFDELHSPISTSEDSPFDHPEEKGVKGSSFDIERDEKTFGTRYSRRDVYEKSQKRTHEESPPTGTLSKKKSLEQTPKGQRIESILSDPTPGEQIEANLIDSTKSDSTHPSDIYSTSAVPVTKENLPASGDQIDCDHFFKIINSLRTAEKAADFLSTPTSDAANVQPMHPSLLDTPSGLPQNFPGLLPTPESAMYSQAPAGYPNAHLPPMPQYSTMTSSFGNNPIPTYSQNFMHNYMQYNPYGMPQQRQPAPYFNMPPYMTQPPPYMPSPIVSPEVVSPSSLQKVVKKAETRVCSLKAVPVNDDIRNSSSVLQHIALVGSVTETVPVEFDAKLRDNASTRMQKEKTKDDAGLAMPKDKVDDIGGKTPKDKKKDDVVSKISKENVKDDLVARTPKEKLKDGEHSEKTLSLSVLKEHKTRYKSEVKTVSNFINDMVKAKEKGARRVNGQDIDVEIFAAQEKLKTILAKFHDMNNQVKQIQMASSNNVEIVPRKVEEATKVKKEKEKPIKKIRYVDCGSYWCDRCNEVFNTSKEMLSHIHTNDHLQLMDAEEKFWPESVEEYNERGADYTDMPLKGIQFIVPVKGFYCSVCKVCLPDQSLAERHIKGQEHNEQYMKHSDEHPDSTQKYESRRSRAVSLLEREKKRKHAEVIKAAKKIKSSVDRAKELACKIQGERQHKSDDKTGKQKPDLELEEMAKAAVKKTSPQIIKFDFADKAKKKIIEEKKIEKQKKPVIYIGKNLSMLSRLDLSKKKSPNLPSRTNDSLSAPSNSPDVTSRNESDKECSPNLQSKPESNSKTQNGKNNNVSQSENSSTSPIKPGSFLGLKGGRDSDVNNAQKNVLTTNSPASSKDEVRSIPGSSTANNPKNESPVYGPALPPNLLPTSGKKKKSKRKRKDSGQIVSEEEKTKTGVVVPLNEIMLPEEGKNQSDVRQEVMLDAIELPKMSPMPQAIKPDISLAQIALPPTPGLPVTQVGTTNVKPKGMTEEERDFLLLGIDKTDMQPLVIPIRPPIHPQLPLCDMPFERGSAAPYAVMRDILPPFPPPLQVPPPPLNLISPCVNIHQPPPSITGIHPSPVMICPDRPVDYTDNTLTTDYGRNSGIHVVEKCINSQENSYARFESQTMGAKPKLPVSSISADAAPTGSPFLLSNPVQHSLSTNKSRAEQQNKTALAKTVEQDKSQCVKEASSMPGKTSRPMDSGAVIISEVPSVVRTVKTSDSINKFKKTAEHGNNKSSDATLSTDVGVQSVIASNGNESSQCQAVDERNTTEGGAIEKNSETLKSKQLSKSLPEKGDEPATTKHDQQLKLGAVNSELVKETECPSEADVTSVEDEQMKNQFPQILVASQDAAIPLGDGEVEVQGNTEATMSKGTHNTEKSDCIANRSETEVLDMSADEKLKSASSESMLLSPDVINQQRSVENESQKKTEPLIKLSGDTLMDVEACASADQLQVVNLTDVPLDSVEILPKKQSNLTCGKLHSITETSKIEIGDLPSPIDNENERQASSEFIIKPIVMDTIKEPDAELVVPIADSVEEINEKSLGIPLVKGVDSLCGTGSNIKNESSEYPLAAQDMEILPSRDYENDIALGVPVTPISKETVKDTETQILLTIATVNPTDGEIKPKSKETIFNEPPVTKSVQENVFLELETNTRKVDDAKLNASLPTESMQQDIAKDADMTCPEKTDSGSFPTVTADLQCSKTNDSSEEVPKIQSENEENKKEDNLFSGLLPNPVPEESLPREEISNAVEMQKETFNTFHEGSVKECQKIFQDVPCLETNNSPMQVAESDVTSVEVVNESLSLATTILPTDTVKQLVEKPENITATSQSHGIYARSTAGDELESSQQMSSHVITTQSSGNENKIEGNVDNSFIDPSLKAISEDILMETQTSDEHQTEDIKLEVLPLKSEKESNGNYQNVSSSNETSPTHADDNSQCAVSDSSNAGLFTQVSAMQAGSGDSTKTVNVDSLFQSESPGALTETETCQTPKRTKDDETPLAGLEQSDKTYEDMPHLEKSCPKILETETVGIQSVTENSNTSLNVVESPNLTSISTTEVDDHLNEKTSAVAICDSSMEEIHDDSLKLEAVAVIKMDKPVSCLVEDKSPSNMPCLEKNEYSNVTACPPLVDLPSPVDEKSNSFPCALAVGVHLTESKTPQTPNLMESIPTETFQVFSDVPEGSNSIPSIEGTDKDHSESQLHHEPNGVEYSQNAVGVSESIGSPRCPVLIAEVTPKKNHKDVIVGTQNPSELQPASVKPSVSPVEIGVKDNESLMPELIPITHINSNKDSEISSKCSIIESVDNSQESVSEVSSLCEVEPNIPDSVPITETDLHNVVALDMPSISDSSSTIEPMQVDCDDHEPMRVDYDDHEPMQVDSGDSQLLPVKSSDTDPVTGGLEIIASTENSSSCDNSIVKTVNCDDQMPSVALQPCNPEVIDKTNVPKKTLESESSMLEKLLKGECVFKEQPQFVNTDGQVLSHSDSKNENSSIVFTETISTDQDDGPAAHCDETLDLGKPSVGSADTELQAADSAVPEIISKTHILEKTSASNESALESILQRDCATNKPLLISSLNLGCELGKKEAIVMETIHHMPPLEELPSASERSIQEEAESVEKMFSVLEALTEKEFPCDDKKDAVSESSHKTLPSDEILPDAGVSSEIKVMSPDSPCNVAEVNKMVTDISRIQPEKTDSKSTLPDQSESPVNPLNSPPDALADENNATADMTITALPDDYWECSSPEIIFESVKKPSETVLVEESSNSCEEIFCLTKVFPKHEKKKKRKIARKVKAIDGAAKTPTKNTKQEGGAEITSGNTKALEEEGEKKVDDSHLKTLDAIGAISFTNIIKKEPEEEEKSLNDDKNLSEPSSLLATEKTIKKETEAETEEEYPAISGDFAMPCGFIKQETDIKQEKDIPTNENITVKKERRSTDTDDDTDEYETVE